MADHENFGTALAWFIVGAAVGATVTLLYSPRSGKDTRRYLNRKADEGREKLADMRKEVEHTSKDIAKKGREVVDEVSDLFEKGRSLVRG